MHIPVIMTIEKEVRKLKKHLNKIIYAVAAVLALVAILMLFAPALKSKVEGLGTIKCFEVAFGKKESAIEVLGFSFLYFLPFLLALIGLVLTVVACLGKGGKILPIIAAVLFVVAGILFFLPKQTFVLGSTYKDMAKEMGDAGKQMLTETKKALAEQLSVGFGAIFAGICSLISAVLVAVSGFLVKPAE